MAASDLVTALTSSSSNSDVSTTSFKDDAEKIAEFEKMLTDIRSQRIPFERQWFLNLAFYFGKHYVQWITAGQVQKLVESTAPSHRVRLTVNKSRVVVRTEMSKLLKERPRGYVVPNTSDDLDKTAAREATKLYEALEKPEALGIQKRFRQSVFWLCTLGNGFAKVYYDKNSKDFTGTMGDIKIEPLSGFALYVPDMLEVDIEKQGYVIQVLSKSTKWVEDTFGLKLNADNNAVNTGISQRMLTALGLNTEKTTTNLVTVKEIWIKPCKKYPKGLVAMWTRDKLISYEEGWPYEHGQYPFIKIDHIPTGRFYTDSTLVDYMPLQKEYNRSVSQIIESRNAMSKPQWIAQKGSIDPNLVTSQPGLIIQHLIGTPPPTPVTPPPIPGYINDLLQRVQSDMNDVSSQHEITKGSTPPGVTAATAISYLQEEDDSKLSLTITSMEEAVQKIASQVLSLVGQFWGVERQIKVTGESSSYEAQAFSKATLRGNTDYRIEVGSSTPRSRAAKQAFLLELFDRQAIKPEQLLKYLDMQETSVFYDDSQVDTRQAEKETMYLSQSPQPMQINDWDNDLVHIDVHEKFQKSEQFDMLPDPVKQSFIQHVKLHKYHLAAMYGRNDLLPQIITDPRTGQPVVDPATGKPHTSAENPQLEGFIETMKIVGPPPLPPPPPPPGMMLGGGQQNGNQQPGQSGPPN